MYLGFESLTLRHNEKQVARPAFCYGKTKRGFEQGGSRRSLRKKTVRWTVFADGVKERSDAKVHGSAPKKSLTLRHKKPVNKPVYRLFSCPFLQNHSTLLIVFHLLPKFTVSGKTIPFIIALAEDNFEEQSR